MKSLRSRWWPLAALPFFCAVAGFSQTPVAAPQQTRAMRKTAGAMDTDMQQANAAQRALPLSYPKGNGLRVLIMGHSWVAPGRLTLPVIAKAAGFTGHEQRSHTRGGVWGTANAIWLNEHGQGNVEPKDVLLLPAIATGQWDVMTWGSYYSDKPSDYTQWIDLCLKSNPKMVFYIQDGWPTERMGAHGDTPAALIASLRQVYATGITPSMQGLEQALNARYPGKVHIIPVGAAVVEMLGDYLAGQLTGFDCIAQVKGGTKGIYGPDSYHLSRTSGINYLAGYCYYAELYRRSPESIPNFCPKGVDPKVDHLMRVAAWHAVTQSPLSGLTDHDHNGVADQFETSPQP